MSYQTGTCASGSAFYSQPISIRKLTCIHIVTSSGAFQFSSLLRLLAASETADDSVLSHETSVRASGPAIVFDSTPGIATVSNAAHSVTVGIKNFIARKIAFGIAAIIVSLLKLIGFLVSSKDIFIRMRETVHDPAFIPLDAPRLYFYSMNDQLVPGAHVEMHIRDARKAGITHITAKKDTSSHVTHMRDDPVGYWAAVRQLWLEGKHIRGTEH